MSSAPGGLQPLDPLDPLDPITLPLRGSRLIEASAGTGKTWTIAALYVRLVIGHGCTPLAPSQILVMTFTKAATRELSDRIRARLVQAAARFRGEPAEQADAFVDRLLDGIPEGPGRRQAAWRLAMAAESMDDAAVHTIDAWCQRMLREHAFDSGCLFDEELQANEAALRAQAVRDYWRQQVYPLQPEALVAVLAQWKNVEALARDVKTLLDLPLPPGAGQGELSALRAVQMQALQSQLATLKNGWDAGADAMLDWLTPIWTTKGHAAAKCVPTRHHATRWITGLRDWALDPQAESLDLGNGEQRLSASELRQRQSEAGVSHPVPACFDDFEAMMAALRVLPAPGPDLRLHAAAHIQQRLQQAKASAGTFGFADMLDRLDRALDAAPAIEFGPDHDPERAARAARLRDRILAQYPVALIDEFQDTSPVQLRIFDRLYRIADDDPARVLLMIGDPKQAIYGFRGADIYSYLRARLATGGRHHVLDTNRRSTDALVRAVNGLFLAAEARAGAGAFEFRDAAGASPVPFVDVHAAGRDERLVRSAGAHPSLTWCVDPELRRKDASLSLFAALCAEQIVQGLNDPRTGFEEAGEPFRRLRPADIAVLVRTGFEADAVRQELRRRGVASVYLSDRDSVFQTVEAEDVLRLLQAVAAPRDVRLARAALGTTLLGRSLPELHALAADDALFDRACETLQRLNAAWKGQGVLSMLRRALHAWGLPARWLAADRASVPGERRLTNVLHLAELLEAASAEVEGEQALIRWLAQQIADTAAGQGGGDERVLRLESDADLVQVVTVHKSKGLEYPLVFLPFPAHFRPALGRSRRSQVLWLPDGSGGRTLVLSPTPEQQAQAEHERLREDLRLLYVALTRARHALWVGVSALQSGRPPVPVWHQSALGCLVSGPAPVDPALGLSALEGLQALQARARPGEIVVEVPLAADPSSPWLRPPVTRVAPRDAPLPLVPAPPYAAPFDRLWSIASYSALVRGAEPESARPTAAAEATNATNMTKGMPVVRRLEGTDASGVSRGFDTTDASDLPALPPLRDDEPDDADPPAGAPRTRGRTPADQPRHRFPRGAYAGHFLHGQLEWLAGERFALDTSEPLQQHLLRRCERQGWGHRAEDVVAWLREVCATPMPAVGAALSGLDQVVPELEFWMPSDGLDATRLDALCRQHLLPGRPRPLLPPRTLRGLLMGFADLVFEHQGRYWVLDYKSNALGPDDASYTLDAMDAAMLEHRYDVQAALYLLALHRLLTARLGAAYAPARHLGGAVYLFLRGVRGPRAGCCHLEPPLALIQALDETLDREIQR